MVMGRETMGRRSNDGLATAPVSHQERRERNATNAIEIKRKLSKIKDADRYSAAHNGLVAGSSPAGRTKQIKELW